MRFISMQLLADFQTLVARVRAKFPAVRIVFSSITPGPGRWDEAPHLLRVQLTRPFLGKPDQP